MKWMYYNILAAAVALSMVGCTDWENAEAEVFDNSMTDVVKSEEYYENLRAYKKSDHSIAFGWYSEWEEGSANTGNTLSAIPDSMDMISLWNNSRNLSPKKRADLEFVQKVKGTKVLLCTFVQYIGKGVTPPEYDTDEETRNAYWGWNPNPADKKENLPAIAKYAKAFADTINAYGYDGLDIDFEPYVDGVDGPLDEDPEYVAMLFAEFSKYLGPKSGTGLTFCVDGEIERIPEGTEVYFDYFIQQAYKVSSSSGLRSRFERSYNSIGRGMTKAEFAKKYIITENLESAIDCLNGGYKWEDFPLDVKPSLVGYADLDLGEGLKKGGFGAYRFSNERANTPKFKWMRKAIQEQNPCPGYQTID